MDGKRKYILAALALTGILLRIVPVWAMPTWYDENFTLILARLPFERMIAATAGDVHPPVWYVLDWALAHALPQLPGWAIVRLPAVAFSIGALWMFWLIVKEMQTSDRVRLVAFGLFAVLPAQVYYAQEGRMYSMLTLLVLAAWYSAITRRWAWLTVTTSLMLWTHNYGLLYAAAIWLAGLTLHLPLKKLTVSIAAAGLTFTPWIFVLFTQMHAIDGTYWMVYTSAPALLADLFHSIFLAGMPGSDVYNFAVFYGMLVFIAYNSISLRKWNIPALLLAFVPFLLAAVISVVWQPIMLYRALVPGGSFLVILAAENLETLFGLKARTMLAAILLVPGLLGNTASVVLRSTWPTTLQEMRGMLLYIDDNWQAGDLLYHADDGILLTGVSYWHNVDNTLRVPPCGPVRGGLTETTRTAIGIQSGALPENYHGRVWVVTSQTPMNPNCEQEALEVAGLLTGEPLACVDNPIVTSCVWLLEK